MKKKSGRKPKRRPFVQIRNGEIVIQKPFGKPSVSPAKIRAAVEKVIAQRGAKIAPSTSR